MLADEDVDGHDRSGSLAASKGKDQTILKSPLTQKSIYWFCKSELGDFAQGKSAQSLQNWFRHQIFSSTSGILIPSRDFNYTSVVQGTLYP